VILDVPQRISDGIHASLTKAPPIVRACRVVRLIVLALSAFYQPGLSFSAA